MIAVNLTEEQKRAQIESDTSLNMFVEAGAGAGKTTLIVKRIVNLLSNGINGVPVKPEEIVVITFTNKAAEELRERIIAAVSRSKDTMSEALQNLDRMNISTIHSFCNVLLREQGLTMGLPIDLELVDETENASLKRKYLNRYLHSLSANDWETVEQLGGEKKSRWNIKKDIEELYQQIAELPMDTEFVIPNASKRMDYSDFEKHLKEFIDGNGSRSKFEELVLEVVETCINQNKNKNGFSPLKLSLSGLYNSEELKKTDGKRILFSPDFCNVIESALNNPVDYSEFYPALVQCIENSKFLIKTSLPVLFDKDKLDDMDYYLKDNIKKELGSEVISIIKDCSAMFGKGAATFEEAFKRKEEEAEYYDLIWQKAQEARKLYRNESPKQYVTNDRLLEYARDLILNHDNACRFFADKYKCFFVDEFQDTDRIQESFIYRLACDHDHKDALRNGALFVVGDPKQSIYRFRGAQPEVYFDVKERMEDLDNAMVYELSNNFRSAENVINWVNEKFTESDLITPIVNQDQYKPMTPRKVKAPSFGDNVVVQGIYHSGYADAFYNKGPLKIEQKTQTLDVNPAYDYARAKTEDDVRNVVSLILNLTKKKEDGNPAFYITDFNDKHEPYYRGIKYSDFLLMSHAKTNMKAYVECMEKYGIPVLLDGIENLGDQRALAVYVRLYFYLINPKEPFFRMGAQEALRSTLHCDSEKEFENLSDGILDCMYADSKRMTPYGKAMYLERQVSALFDKQGNVISHNNEEEPDPGTGKNEQIISTVNAQKTQRLIRQMIETIFAGDSVDGVAIAKQMREYADGVLEHELALDPNSDAVRFMNLHKTKGLEGNIIILLDRRGKKQKSINNYQDGIKYYPGISGWTPVKNDESIVEKAKKEELAEFHRLEYVAVTRAKQAAIFMDVQEKGGMFATQKLGKSNTKTDKYGNRITYYSTIDETTYGYDLNETPDINDVIRKVLTEDEMELPDTSLSVIETYDCSRDEYPREICIPKEEKPVLVRESPSHLEKNTSKKKSMDDDVSPLFRPKGNIVGNTLHRTMEILVGKSFSLFRAGKWDGNPLTEEYVKLMDTSINQAIDENKVDLNALSEKAKKEDKNAPDMVEATRKFIRRCEAGYAEFLKDKWKNIAEIYPEVNFSYMTEGDEPVWMNGQADLIIKMKDGKYLLIDYKSDTDKDVAECDMIDYLNCKYSPQLKVYRSVIRDILKTDPKDIKTAVVSFSQKDEDGNTYSDETVRVRYTEIVVSDETDTEIN